MRRNDATYLAAVAVLTAVMLLLLLWPDEGGGAAGLWDTPPPGAGTPRDIDPAQFRELIRQRRLSDHEAGFYRVLEEENRPPQ